MRVVRYQLAIKRPRLDFLCTLGCALWATTLPVGCNRCTEQSAAESHTSASEPDAPQTPAAQAPKVSAKLLPPPTVPPGPAEILELEAPIGPEHILNLSYAISDLAFEVRLNGIWVSGETEPGSPSGTARIEHFLRTGKNALDVSVTKVDGEHSSGAFRLLGLSKEAGGKTPLEETLLEVNFAAGDAPFARRFVFEAKSPYRLWKETEVLELDDQTAREVIRASLDAHRSFSEKDVDEMMTLLAFKAKEMGTLSGVEETKALDGQRKFVEMIFKSETFSVKPLDEEDLHLQLVADGRLVHVTRSGEPLLMSGTHGPGFEAYFGKVDGKYVIVR